ncbi:ABC transporter substrate-binding protein [Georgenia sp. EYE_87]|nr:ABC transporter substrate-binding protein [Georgenia sp. EYE_87]MCK6210099.1 ABC transporter substrate-binding protein [Georgenia sp. EYE_87]
MKKTLGPVGALAAAVALAACGGGGAAESGGGEAPTTGSLTPVTVGVMPIVDTAAIFLGEKEGIFAEHGLDLTFEMAQGGAAIIPAVVSGTYDFGFSNVPSLIVATGQGLPLRLIAPANTTTGDTTSDFSAVVVPEGSDIQSPSDLAGRTVAVSTLKNIGDVTVSHVVKGAGGDPSAVEFVEMPFPDMPAALASGRVDAIWVLEPFLTIAKNDGGRVISHNYAETDPELLIAAYFTTGDYAAKNSDTVEAFTAAMVESQSFARDNPDEARAILGEYTEISPEVREQLVMPEFPTELSAAAVDLHADLALEYGLVTEPVDVAALLP